MSEHWPEKTIGDYISCWCDTCGRHTQRRIDRVSIDSRAGKTGSCTSPHHDNLTEKQKQHAAEAIRRQRNPGLFE